VKVTQQIAARDYAWISEIVGTVVSYEQKQTGSWFAHSRGDKLWLDRLTVRKDDGELTSLVLDEFSNIEIEHEAPAHA
jgi:protein-L-isoaspartate O-methyltransferase